MKFKIIMTVLVIVCLLVSGLLFVAYTNNAKNSNIKTENLSSFDAYLYKNFSITLNLNSEKDLYITCNPQAATTTHKNGSRLSYLCKNQDSTHRILIGWVASDETNISTLQKIGNAQLSFGTSTETGTLACADNTNLLTIKNSVASGQCVMTTLSGKKLYTTTVFLQYPSIQDKRFFVTVMNVGETTSSSDIESYLMSLFTQTIIKNQSKAHSAYFEKVYAGEGGSDGGSCTSSDISCAPAYDGNGNPIDATNVIAPICVQTGFGPNDQWECSCPSGSVKDANGNCIVTVTTPPTVSIAVSPSSIAYGGFINSLSYTSSDATACSFFDTYGGNSYYAWALNGAPLSYAWGASGPYTESHVYTVSCANAYGVVTQTATLTVAPPPPTGSLSVSATTCSIVAGASSCPINVTWSTVNPLATSAVTRNNPTPGQTIFTGNNGGPSASMATYPSTGFYLYNSGNLLDSKTVTATCADGINKWDSISGVCANPQVTNASIVGQYYPPGKLSLSCVGATSYSVTRDGTVVIAPTTYTGAVNNYAVGVAGNYTIKCIHGSVSDQVVRVYSAAPPRAEIKLSIVPVSVAKNSKVVVSWNTKYPTNACSLTAQVVCPNNACSVEQAAYQNSLTTILATGVTDPNDPSSSRNIQTAVKTLASSAELDSTYRALGKKTLTIGYTTDLTYSCGGTNKETKRIKVTSSTEQ